MPLSEQVLGGFKSGMSRSSRRGGKDGAQKLWTLQNGYVTDQGDAVPRPGLQHLANVAHSAGLYGADGQLHVFYGDDDAFVDPMNPLVQGHLLRYPIQVDPDPNYGTPLADFLTDTPLLYWPLNGTSQQVVKDFSGNGYDGTAMGAFLWTGAGLKMTDFLAGVLLAVGTPTGSPIDVGSLDEWAMEQVITVQGTIGGPGGTGSGTCMAQWRSPNFGFFNAGMVMDYRLADGNHYLRAGFSEDLVSTSANDPSPLTVNTRVHYLVTKRAGSLYLYKNGTQVATVISTTNPIHTDGAAFVIGAPNNTYQPNSQGWIGTVEHTAVYAHALTAARALVHAQAVGLAS